MNEIKSAYDDPRTCVSQVIVGLDGVAFTSRRLREFSVEDRRLRRSVPVRPVRVRGDLVEVAPLLARDVMGEAEGWVPFRRLTEEVRA